jgi:acyl-coenzyme A thioesterase PaaI-like protein
MAFASSLRARLPSRLAEAPGNPVRDLWDRLERVPGGSRLFTRAVGMMAPYTATIGARVEVLRLGHSEVTLADRRAVRNHIRCVHAIALANLAELAGNVALAYSLPDDARFIVAKLEIEYSKKARGTIRAIVDCEVPASNERREYPVVVRMLNSAGEEVARSTLYTLVGPKRSS